MGQQPLNKDLILNYLKFFPGKYLGIIDVDGKEEILFTIRALRQDDVQNPDGGTEQKPVLSFEETDKGLILNRTNADSVAALHGPDVNNWAGQKILLYTEKGLYAYGKKWDVLRVRDYLPPTNQTAATASPGDDDLAF